MKTFWEKIHSKVLLCLLKVFHSSKLVTAFIYLKCVQKMIIKTNLIIYKKNYKINNELFKILSYEHFNGFCLRNIYLFLEFISKMMYL